MWFVTQLEAQLCNKCYIARDMACYSFLKELIKFTVRQLQNELQRVRGAVWRWQYEIVRASSTQYSTFQGPRYSCMNFMSFLVLFHARLEYNKMQYAVQCCNLTNRGHSRCLLSILQHA